MAKKQPKAKKRDTDQSQRFKEAARALGVGESAKAFERAFKKIVPPKTPSAGRRGDGG